MITLPATFVVATYGETKFARTALTVMLTGTILVRDPAVKLMLAVWTPGAGTVVTLAVIVSGNEPKDEGLSWSHPDAPLV